MDGGLATGVYRHGSCHLWPHHPAHPVGGPDAAHRQRPCGRRREQSAVRRPAAGARRRRVCDLQHGWALREHQQRIAKRVPHALRGAGRRPAVRARLLRHSAAAAALAKPAAVAATTANAIAVAATTVPAATAASATTATIATAFAATATATTTAQQPAIAAWCRFIPAAVGCSAISSRNTLERASSVAGGCDPANLHWQPAVLAVLCRRMGLRASGVWQCRRQLVPRGWRVSHLRRAAAGACITAQVPTAGRLASRLWPRSRRMGVLVRPWLGRHVV